MSEDSSETHRANGESDMFGHTSPFAKLGNRFVERTDPLEEFNPYMNELDYDLLNLYILAEIEDQAIAESTADTKKRIIRNWGDHMSEFSRHPVCPNKNHVINYIKKEITKGNKKSTIVQKLRKLSNMFEFFAGNEYLPHGQSQAKGYNPIDEGRRKMKNDIEKVKKRNKKIPHYIPNAKLGQIIRDIKNLLHRTVIVLQLKYGIRSLQLANIQFADILIHNDDLQDLYPNLGSNPIIQNLKTDVIYIPSKHERKGNKSALPTLMPIDTETKDLLINYLRIRPPVEEPWIILNNSNSNKLTNDIINNIWKSHFIPEYEETERFKPLRSHYARHKFTTHWRTNRGIRSEYTKYMRGSDRDNFDLTDQSEFYDYVHTYYNDIEDIYLNQIYKFGI